MGVGVAFGCTGRKGGKHMDKKRTAFEGVPATIASSVGNDDEAAKANEAMGRRFRGRTGEESPAEAVDVAEVFRNQS